MALNFVPRKVGKPKAQTSQTGSASASNASQIRVNEDTKGKGKALSQPTPDIKPWSSDEDVCAVISLALSDYAIWLNSEVIREITDSLRGGHEGFISLTFLLKNSPVLKPLLSSSMPETAIIKALRASKSHLDVRMVFVKPEWQSWGKGQRQKDAGMYEIRRQDWALLLPRMERFTKDYWENRTIYMENLPVSCKSIATISRFVESLFSPSNGSEPSSSFTKTQDITLPPHHLDREGDEPKCKGLALVILSSTENVEALLKEWPWERASYGTSAIPSSAREGHRYGLRCLSKARWNVLREEYLAYRQSLVDELVAFEDTQQQVPPFDGSESPVESDRESLSVEAPNPPSTSLTPYSPFPISCLVFVRNVHPETNKTTLKALFSKVFEQSPSMSQTGLDYVDYNKGMDSCYLRLSSPAYAIAIVEHFTSNMVVQASGLDTTGAPQPLEPGPNSGHARIGAELVLGRKEEIYWEKVPLKVRAAAVEKCLKETRGKSASHENAADDGDGDGDGPKRRKRKRK